MVNLRSMFVESGRSASMRKLATVTIFDYLRRHRPPGCSLRVDLEGDHLRFSYRLWWPWWLALGLAHLALFVWATRSVRRGLQRQAVPMRLVTIKVGTRAKRPRKL